MKILLLVRMSFANVSSSSSSSLGNCSRQIKCIRDEATLTLSLMYRTHTPTSYLVAQHRERERVPSVSWSEFCSAHNKKKRKKESVCVQIVKLCYVCRAPNLASERERVILRGARRYLCFSSSFTPSSNLFESEITFFAKRILRQSCSELCSVITEFWVFIANISFNAASSNSGINWKIAWQANFWPSKNWI